MSKSFKLVENNLKQLTLLNLTGIICSKPGGSQLLRAGHFNEAHLSHQNSPTGTELGLYQQVTRFSSFRHW